MFFQVFFLFFLGSIFSYFLQPYSYLGLEAHKFCLSQAPVSLFQKFYQAIVCGYKIRSGSNIEMLKNLGVVHIIVVSGAHLLFFSRFLKTVSFSRISGRANLLILLLFVCTCQFQLPALRAWIQLLLSKLNLRLKLFNSPPLNILLSIVFCLSLTPQDFHRTSLIMSWLASLAIYLGNNTFSQSIYCYFFLSPLLIQFQMPHPWTIAINAFFVPILCIFLFPLSLISFFIKPFAVITDYFWFSLLKTSDTLSAYLEPLPTLSNSWPPILLWSLPLSINLVLIYRFHKI